MTSSALQHHRVTLSEPRNVRANRGRKVGLRSTADAPDRRSTEPDSPLADLSNHLRSDGKESAFARRLLEIVESYDQWADAGTPPLDVSAIQRAQRILQLCSASESPIGIFSSEEGGITIRSIHDGISVAIEVGPAKITAFTVRDLADDFVVQTVDSEESAAAYLAQPA